MSSSSAPPHARQRVEAMIEKVRAPVPAALLAGTHMLDGRAADALAAASAELIF
jgi:hypothetical protein